MHPIARDRVPHSIYRTNCTAESGSGSSFGGGVYALGAAILLDTTISASKAVGIGGWGGGIDTGGGLTTSYSTLEGNEATTWGGAVYIRNMAGAQTYISNTTISGNGAYHCGGAVLDTTFGVNVSNSTISGNAATYDGGLCTYGHVTVANSTIAFNTAAYKSGGLLVQNGALTLQSSIIAHDGSGAGPPDLLVAANATLNGASNLVMSSSGNITPSVIELTSDPQLDPQLRNNGGRTRTHMLLPNSPAIRTGNDNMGLYTDQRGRGYPRTTGANYKTDIGAVQFEWIFVGDFDG